MRRDGKAWRGGLDPGGDDLRRRLRHADRRLARQPRCEYAAPVDVPSAIASADPARRLQRRAISYRRTSSRKQQAPRAISPASSIRPIRHADRARNCGSDRSIFFSSASLQDHHPPPSPASTGTLENLRRQGRRSSSTTPTPPAGFGRRADAASASRRPWLRSSRTAWRHDAAHRSPTPTIRSCPRRSKHGRCGLFERLLPRHMQIIYGDQCQACWWRRAAKPRKSVERAARSVRSR